MKKPAINYHGQITAEEFAKLKNEHGEIFTIEVPMNDTHTDVAVAYFKKVDRAIMGAAMSLWDTNPLKAKEIVLTSCFIAGNKDILEKDDLYFPATNRVDDMITFRKATLKKN
jgi:hypothetical protein